MRYAADRATALAALEDFLPRVPSYATERSYVRDDYREVSRLSAHIRRRVITEEEVARAVLTRHPFATAQKFVQEVVWRTYWKGWLERRPGVWTACVERATHSARAARAAPWGELYQRACRGETELSYFNEWIHELTTTGYLHNHVRMWFASIWIFTFRIPWELGAMFMYRHLLDGDPASNTLSWRWVAGLQTKGKHYLATPDNIATFSGGRWRPAASDLVVSSVPVEELPSPTELTNEWRPEPLPNTPYGVLTTSEDLSIECDAALSPRAGAIFLLENSTVGGESPRLDSFVEAAHVDALTRLGDRGHRVGGAQPIIETMRLLGLTHLVVVTPCVGPNLTEVVRLSPALEATGVRLTRYRRSWDVALHHLADKGFFPFWERVKKLIESGRFPS